MHTHTLHASCDEEMLAAPSISLNPASHTDDDVCLQPDVDTHTDDDSTTEVEVHAQILNNIERLEILSTPLTPTYSMYNKAPFEKFPASHSGSWRGISPF